MGEPWPNGPPRRRVTLAEACCVWPTDGAADSEDGTDEQPTDDETFGFPAGLWRTLGSTSAPGMPTRQGVEEPASRPLADFGPGLLALDLPTSGDRDRTPRLDRLRAPVPPGHSGPRRLSPPALLQLAQPPGVAVPAHRGAARWAWVGPGAGGAGQAVVGHAEAVRVAGRAIGGQPARTPVARHDRRGHRLRDGHRHLEHPVRLHLRVQLLHRPLLRGLGLHHRIRRPRESQAAHHGAQPAARVRFGPSCTPRWPTPGRSPWTPTDWWPPRRPSPRSADGGRWPWWEADH